MKLFKIISTMRNDRFKSWQLHSWWRISLCSAY